LKIILILFIIYILFKNEEKFDTAAVEVKQLTYRPSDSELLDLYAYYKQGTIGDNETEKPGIFDLKGSVSMN